MPTDQLLHPFDGDSDMDRALRDILPPMPRSTDWEAHQRDTLLTFVETGDVRAERTTPASVDGAIITVEAPSPNDRRRRAVVVLGMAAAAVLLSVGLVTAPRWRGQEIPPVTAPASVPATTAPAPSDELLFPDLFPMLPDDHPLADQAVASCCTWQRRSDPAAQVLVAIDDGTGLSGSVLLQVYPTVTPGMWGGLEAERITVADIAGTLYSDRGTPEIKTFVADGEPVLAVQALDPVAFIEAAGGVPVHSKIGVAGNLVFDVRTLPDGYAVLAEWPAAVAVVTAGTLMSAGTLMPGEGEGMAVFVERMHPLSTRPMVGDFEYVDVNGSTGFWLDMEFDSDLVWQVSDHTWARVPRWPGADTADMLELARSVEFVDRATWEQRYGVELGSHPTREELDMIDESGATATTTPGPFGADDVQLGAHRDCQLIGVSPSNFERRIEIDCGSGDGLRVGTPVLFDSGLVGTISDLSDSAGVVTLVTDAEFAVAAEVRGTGIVGVVRGVSGDSAPQLDLDDPLDAGPHLSGMVIVTAGDPDRMTPAGIAIGRLTGTATAEGSLTIDPLPSPSGAGDRVRVLIDNSVPATPTSLP